MATVKAQNVPAKKYAIRTIAFYNLENLFDTINDLTKNDEASPIMELKGNRSKVYWDKIDKLQVPSHKLAMKEPIQVLLLLECVNRKQCCVRRLGCQ